jgi:purine-binding chemotaxis protein CheW
MIDQRQFCTFRLDGFLFGIEVLDVQEVLRYQEMTRVPRAPETIAGLLNLRGEIVTAVDLRRRLALGLRPTEELPMNVIVRTEGGAVSFLVDSIGDVVDVDEERFETPPETLSGPARGLIRGAYKLENELLLMLDTERASCLEASSITGGAR